MTGASSADFERFFVSLAGEAKVPYDWQQELANSQVPRSRLIRIPTGMGKTLGVLAAWSWHRLMRGDERWPRRLVWCLPMRVLVEQTEAVARRALQRLNLLWAGAGSHRGRVGVHLLMGGADSAGDWHLHPEDCAVLIGTQDMLLSRALNRGYAAGRARWPLEFGLLSHDTLWVVDEAQLMDVGLATTAQLQAYLDADKPKGFRPRHTWWTSATLQPRWLESVDTRPHMSDWTTEPVTLPSSLRHQGLGAISKGLTCSKVEAGAARAFAGLVLEGHRATVEEGFGRITLVVCNTVERACETFDQLRFLAPEQAVELVHSRFRVADRTRWRDDFLNREACRPGADLIVVATQVVEAGVDLSAGSLVTELAPWSSLVQRFGRCARYGGTGQVHVVDRGSDRDALPYEEHEMNAAREALSALVEAKTGAGIASLEDFEAGLGAEALGRLYPYEPSHLLLRREFEELFDTTPDLTGADLDIGRYIRSGDERDLLVCWREIPRADKGRHPSAPPHDWKPHRGELCAVPFLKARDWLCGKESKDKPSRRLRNRVRAWIWDWLEGCWAVAERTTLLPGRVVCVASEVGGYRPVRGFDPESTDRVPETQDSHLAGKVLPEVATEESDGCDELSVAAWKTIGCHGREVAREAEELARTVGLPGSLCKTLALAGLWHDVGKSHPAFQGSIRSAEDKRPERQDLAKAPPKAWLRPAGTYRTADDRDHRPGLRHELASALALFAVLSRRAPRHPALLGRWMEALELAGRGAQPEPESTDELTPAERAVLDCTAEEFDLLAYLVASHHGKVRVALHAGPRDQEYPDRGDGRGLPIRGVREGDELPALALGEGGPQVPAAKLTLEPAALGLSLRTGSSWRERTLGLAARFGPAGLAWLEALLIAADRRASRLVTPDPQLAAKAEVAP